MIRELAIFFSVGSERGEGEEGSDFFRFLATIDPILFISTTLLVKGSSKKSASGSVKKIAEVRRKTADLRKSGCLWKMTIAVVVVRRR